MKPEPAVKIAPKVFHVLPGENTFGSNDLGAFQYPADVSGYPFGLQYHDITQLIILVALVSLLVGALGIANIMLVSVTERTREIGIRRSLGATRSHVLIQFLTEAVVLGTAGGALGVLGGAAIIQFYIGEDAVLMWDWVIYSFAICAGIGAVAGIYPAIRAAHQDVIDALRYE